jgi:biotin carboxyl carrier protein
MKLTFNTITLDFSPAAHAYRAVIGGQTFEVELIRVEEGRLDLRINGERFTAYVSSANARRWVTVNGQTFALTRQSGARQGSGGHHSAAGDLTAPMPGQVRAVNVREGQAVTKGQTLLVLEAMKMEIRIQASADGIVKKLFVKQGETVEREQMLVEIVEREGS